MNNLPHFPPFDLYNRRQTFRLKFFKSEELEDPAPDFKRRHYSLSTSTLSSCYYILQLLQGAPGFIMTCNFSILTHTFEFSAPTVTFCAVPILNLRFHTAPQSFKYNRGGGCLLPNIFVRCLPSQFFLLTCQYLKWFSPPVEKKPSNAFIRPD
ncbi:hypothetical protein BDQ17DRAFT_874203 [Cyathus striatus]|nr:hypothetical protein BDQ17DRAFT_874203 [Cyathus striatus]